MKMFSDCSGECCVCSCGDFCLAGHGDDDFWPASKEQVVNRLDNGKYVSYRDMMKAYLLIRYGYTYQDNAERGKS